MSEILKSMYSWVEEDETIREVSVILGVWGVPGCGPSSGKAVTEDCELWTRTENETRGNGGATCKRAGYLGNKSQTIHGTCPT